MTARMSSITHNLYRAEQVRELDRIAIEDHKIAGQTLMQRAGKVAFETLQDRYPAAQKITVLCGNGNNGGDGYVLARAAYDDGANVRLIHLGDPEKLQGDAKQAANTFAETGLTPESYSISKIKEADILVDAILGTGLDREITGELKTTFEQINRLDIPVLAIDIPSGLNADTGRVMGCAIEAEITVTFIGLKQGLFTAQGPHCTGHVVFNNLAVPGKIYESMKPASHRIELDDLCYLLPPRSRSAHKGHFGHVLVIGGERGYIGAARMASEAALRVGAGLVSLATRAEHAAVISAARPEIMSHGVEKPTQLVPLMEQANVIAIGPGLGQSQWALALLSKVLEGESPIVMDADALNLLAKEPLQYEKWILTPHPGEAARLLEKDSLAIQNERFSAAQDLQDRYGGTIVLKGSGTIITKKDHAVSVCSNGNPGMASGGMGDVLTGTIAGLAAQGIDNYDAACLGVSLHARAADNAAIDGERGLIASDLMPWLRRLVNPSQK